MTADNAEPSQRHVTVASVDELFRGSGPVRSSEDLARSGIFDDGEVEEFLTDLSEMRRADIA
jgi:hypothetical protein